MLSQSLDYRRQDLIDELDAAVEHGRTLPAPWYTDPEVLAIEQERIFRHTWQLVGHTGNLVDHGDYFTASVAGVPIVVVRDDHGDLNGLVNICRHRGHVVVEGCGRRRSLQCPYHAWNYGLDGSLLRAPRSDREPHFDKSAHPLLRLQVGTWGPLVFANLDNDAPAFDDTFADLVRIAGERGVDWASSRCRFEEQWEMRCNWKVFYDNGAECYHCPSVHPSFMRTYEVGPEEYRLEKYEAFVYHRSPARQLERAGGTVDWEMYAAWPSWSIATGERPGVVFAWSSVPIAVDRLSITTYSCAGSDVPDEALAEELDWWRHIVNQEDRAVCEGVQCGLAGGMVYDGPLLLDSEHVIQHFQQQLRGALKGDAPVAIR